jgi:BCD family chlorophyll transporter-like MFS transporter
MAENETPQNLSVGRNVKIGMFHVGSGMADVLATGVWNRIMISDLGFSATPVSLLASLRYFLAPLSVWAGRMSDDRAIGGYRRLSWIWSGRLMMVISLMLLGWTTAALVGGAAAGFGMWAVITLAMLLFSLGSALSGSTFLALIYDRAPEHQRGRAVGIVWTFLLVGFTVAGIFFGLLLPSDGDPANGFTFTAGDVLNLFIIGAVAMGVLWFVSVWGEEKRTRNTQAAAAQSSPEGKVSIRDDLKIVWRDRRMRAFFWYLGLSMFFAFAQDPVLEPFAGDVFGMDAAVTTRFAAYWGSMSILGSLFFLWLSRRRKWLTNTRMSYIGVAVLVATFALFTLSSVMEIRQLVTPGLILLGLGLGLWNIGTLGLMMDMSPAGRAGTFLGFWTLVVTFGRGFGVAGGGILRDVVLSITSSLQISYGAVFFLEVIGLGVALWMLSQVRIEEFKADLAATRAEGDTAAILAGAMD